MIGRHLGLGSLLLLCVSAWAQTNATPATRYIVNFTNASPPTAQLNAYVQQHPGAKFLGWVENQPAAIVSSPSPLADGANIQVAPELTGTPRAISGRSQAMDDVLGQGAGQVVPWGIQRVLASLARSSTTVPSAPVCIIGTGIAYDHPDLMGTVISEYFEVSPLDPTLDLYPIHNGYDDEGAGTAEAGVIAALDNTFGVVGVAAGVPLIAVKAAGYRIELDPTTQQPIVSYDAMESDVVNGIYDCIAANAQVILFGIYFSQASTLVHNALGDAAAAGILVVAGAGDNGDSATHDVNWPAAFPEVLSISSITEAGSLAAQSSWGAKVDFSAPGDTVLTLSLVDGLTGNGTYTDQSGSDLAAAHVAGVAALMRSSAPYSGINDLIGTSIGLDGSQQGQRGFINALLSVSR